jgi:S-adenosylmethionine-diacylglycerol 3-amino-3-carboxypropyl transferase
MTGAFSPWVDDIARLPVAFAQVREDATLDQWVVEQLGTDVQVLMVASGGCTAALLASLTGVERLHLVDPNMAQIELSRLKLHLLKTAETRERLALLGHGAMRPGDRQDRLTAALQSLGIEPVALGPVRLWASEGPDFAGRYEQLFVHLRARLYGRMEELIELLRLRDPIEQALLAAPDTKLGHALDEAFDEVMALPNLVRLFGEEATKNRVEPFSRHFARRTRHVLATIPAADNPYLWQVFMGRFPDGIYSPWLSAPIPARVPQITWICAPIAEALREASAEYNYIHLSNILDWESPDNARATLEMAWQALRPGGMVLIRQLNSTLDVPALSSHFQWQSDLASVLHFRDRSYFYRALHLGKKA